MGEATYVAGVPRTAAGFDSLAWQDGERPDWWRQDLKAFKVEFGGCVWLFRKHGVGPSFSTQDLDRAVATLQKEMRYESSEDAVQRAVFDSIPLSVDLLGDLPPNDADWHRLARCVSAWEVVLAHPISHIRWQMTRLRDLRAQIKGIEADTTEHLLRVGQGFVLAGHGELMFGEDSPYNLGISPTQLRDLARNTGNYELVDFCIDYLERTRAERQEAREQEQQARDERQEKRTATKRDAELVEQFLGYLRNADFTPQDRREQKAVDMHRAWRETKDDVLWTQRELALREYIRRHVVNDEWDTKLGPDTANGSKPTR